MNVHPGPAKAGPDRHILLRPEGNADLRQFTDRQQDELIVVMQELRIPVEHDPDEGSWQPSPRSKISYYYRRGLTRQKRANLRSAEAEGRDLDSETVSENLWDVVIIYRSTTANECIRYRCQQGFTVLRIWPICRVLGALGPSNLHQLFS